jgi:hypothetical protein
MIYSIDQFERKLETYTDVFLMTRWASHPQEGAPSMRIDKAIIYETASADPKKDRVVRDSRSGRLTIVALSNATDIPAVARELADGNVRLIELCGGISPAWRHKVSKAVAGKAKVSSVTFGIESLPLAAAYNAAFLAGKAQREAFIFIEADADPARDRFTRTGPGQNTTFVAVPDEETGAKVAAELAGDGFALIELYGGFTSPGIAAVIEAVNGRAPVGAGSFALDALDMRSLQPA